MLFKKNTKNKGSSCQISLQGLLAVLQLCSGCLAASTVRSSFCFFIYLWCYIGNYQGANLCSPWMGPRTRVGVCQGKLHVYSSHAGRMQRKLLL